ncbi:MAG: hypothetical protein IH878_20390 [Gemmatimonadetes bacterium]|nr:hypothetical protein [Gemmatimonadota bacterium]
MFKRFAMDWQSWRLDVEEYLDAGVWRCRPVQTPMTTVKSQRTFSAAAVHVYELENGKIRRFCQNGWFWEIGLSRLGSVGRSLLVSGASTAVTLWHIARPSAMGSRHAEAQGRDCVFYVTLDARGDG